MGTRLGTVGKEPWSLSKAQNIKGGKYRAGRYIYIYKYIYISFGNSFCGTAALGNSCCETAALRNSSFSTPASSNRRATFKLPIMPGPQGALSAQIQFPF